MNSVATVFVFQYGSNLSVARMQEPKERIPQAQPVETASTIDHYDFCFPVRSEKYNRAVSGILPNVGGRAIFGVIYAIASDMIGRDKTQPKKPSMDRIEGEGKNYYRTTIRVKGIRSGDESDVITYLPKAQENPGYTDTEYAAYILAGLAEWNAPSDYVQYIRNIINKALPEGLK